QIEDLKKRLSEKQLDVKLTEAAKDYIIDEGFDPAYGARPLKRFIQSKLETLLARKIIADDVEAGSVLTVDCVNGELKVV
ncbi:MAG: hypothetical protein K5858_06685, partial [Lachnospiraceae bacterium]|nr:hypothetical protein [Lachnospiraceae bacterium]